MAHFHTGSTVIDEFANRFVYFYTGYLAAPRIFALARIVAAQPESGIAGLVIWGLINGLFAFNGLAELPLVSLALRSNQPRSIDYPFTLIELRLNKDGEGEGKMSLATKIIADKENNIVMLENYAIQPLYIIPI